MVWYILYFVIKQKNKETKQRTMYSHISSVIALTAQLLPNINFSEMASSKNKNHQINYHYPQNCFQMSAEEDSFTQTLNILPRFCLVHLIEEQDMPKSLEWDQAHNHVVCKEALASTFFVCIPFQTKWF